jgi:hypothetical protein
LVVNSKAETKQELVHSNEIKGSDGKRLLMTDEIEHVVNQVSGYIYASTAVCIVVTTPYLALSNGAM